MRVRKIIAATSAVERKSEAIQVWMEFVPVTVRFPLNCSSKLDQASWDSLSRNQPASCWLNSSLGKVV